jgi:hypothetical protein
LSEYMKANEKLDIPKILDFMYPKFFEIVPRNTMQEMLESTLKDPDLELKMWDLKYFNITEDKIFENVFSSKASYSMKVSMKFKEDPLNDVILEALERVYKKGNVKFDTTTKTYEIFSEKTLLLIKDTAESDWLVLGLEPNLSAIYHKILPKSLIEHYGM